VRCAKTTLRSRHRSLFARNRVKTNTNERIYEIRTNIGLAKEASALGRGRRRWGALNLRRRGRARLAHTVRSVHLGFGVVVMYRV
jgi:hypothetical protein